MGKKDVSDPLEEAKLGQHNEQLGKATPAAAAAELLATATRALPRGIPADSPVGAMEHDKLLQIANDYDLGNLATQYSVPELRLVVEYRRQGKRVAAPSNTTGVAPPPAVPLQPTPAPLPKPLRKQIKGVPESATGEWTVKTETRDNKPKTVHWQGQAFHLKYGTVINVNHYGADGVAAIAAQGIELEPYDSKADA